MRWEKWDQSRKQVHIILSEGKGMVTRQNYVKVMALGKVIAAVSPYLKFQVFSQEYKLSKCKKNYLKYQN